MFNHLHKNGYVILPQKIHVPKHIIRECCSLFTRKKVIYTFNGISTSENDKKRYMSILDESSTIQKWMQKTHEMLVKHKLVTDNLFYDYSTLLACAAGCKSQPPHSDYVKSPEFVSLLDHQDAFQPHTIKKEDCVLYTKEPNPVAVTVKQIHLDDYPNYYYTIKLPDNTEKQTVFQYLSNLPETENEKYIRHTKIPLFVLTAIMDNTTIDVWENSINWMQMADNETFQPSVQKKTLTLQSGQICVFRSDLVHAGSAYSNENIRIYSFYNGYHILPDKNKVYMFGNNTEWEKEIASAN